jgi:polyisoprenoid-binding protein YceI
MYALLAAICLVGWAAASATILPWRLWWLMPMPALVATDTAAHEWWAGWHQGLVWAFLVLLTGHVLAALRHQFILKNRVLLRMWKGLLLATVLIACPVLTAQGQERTFHSNGGELRFTARYEDQALMGVFHEFRARLSTDAGGAPLDLRVEVSTGSADMNDADVNSALTESDWFDVEAFPLAVFSSDTMEHLSGNDFLARGRLDLKGRESPLSFTCSLREENGHPTLSGRAELSRLAWNVGAGEWAEPDTIADTVSIEFRVRMEPGR